jgi:hypothetical protein
MAGMDWSREEVEAVVADYFAMLALDLARMPYNKAEHRRALQQKLNGRSEQSIEFKHQNISAVLLDLKFNYIPGYKPRSNYQRMLAEVVADRLPEQRKLLDIAAADADRPVVVPEVDDILAILTEVPRSDAKQHRVSERLAPSLAGMTNYIEREARNRSLGLAGEEFVLNFERARLIRDGRENLASKIEHTSQVRGDHEGYDILSFDKSGAERLIEVKTTKYGRFTPFFASRNEVEVSERNPTSYHVYRMFDFRDRPQLYVLPGPMSMTCELSAASFMARPR